METPKSAKDVMQNYAQAQKQVVDLVMTRVISRKQMSGNTIYTYCPNCYRRVKRANIDYKSELKPLWCLTNKNLYKLDNSLGMVMFEKTYQCQVCKDEKGKDKVFTASEIIDLWLPEKTQSAEEKLMSKFIRLDDKRALENF